MKITVYKNAALMIIATATALGVATTSFAAEDTMALKKEIQLLKQRLSQLEQRNAQQPVMEDFDAWDPFAQMHDMQRMLKQLDYQNYFNPRIDVKESDKQYTITMDIPGMDKNNIEVTVKDNYLIISGERNSAKEEKAQDKYFRQERSFGHFVRSMPLPDDVETSGIDAQYDKGVLTIKLNRIAKVPAPAVQKITVK